MGGGKGEEPLSEEMIDATLADSFPASDPPSWTMGRERDPRAERSRPESEPQAMGSSARLRGPAFLFDLDGTLVDSVYQHVLSWHEALEASGFNLSVWRIHRRIGMSGGLLVNALVRETGHRITADEAQRLQALHTEAYLRRVAQVRPLRGARELLAYLSQAGVPWAIATSGRQESAARSLELLELTSSVPLVTRDQVERAKPDPDLFLAAAERLGVSIGESVVVGDSVWDLLAARRARTLGVGLLSGGYGEDELERAGAYRVYEDPADLLNHLDEVGIRPAR
jgi:HAD superfamily hydrolase (TIGR01549 family)